MGLFLFGAFDALMFNLIPILMFLTFLLVTGIIIYRAVQGVRRWNKNNNSPVLTVEATLVTKRSDVRYHHHHVGTSGMHRTSSTAYFATFEVASGDRMELKIADSEYGMLVEGDLGKLTFQGTRYLGFERSASTSAY